MPATYRALMLTGKGGLDKLVPVDLPVREPVAGEARVRVHATGIGFTDVTMRRSRYIFAPPYPFVPGYEIVGTVDAVGPGVTNVQPGARVAALTVHGGYAEFLYRGADELVPVPAGLDDVDAVALILNYVTAWQMMTRVAQAKAGETALVTGASGGVGAALLELLAVEGVRVFGTTSERAEPIVRALGATPLRSRSTPLPDQLRDLVPGGVDMAFDGIGGQVLSESLRSVRRGGRAVAYGFTSGSPGPLGFIGTMISLYIGTRLRGRRGSFYGISGLYRRDRRPFLEDLPKLFALLGAGKLHPRIKERVRLQDIPRAQEALERGGVDGKFVLVFDGKE